jgi:hypothetical protein
MHTHTYIHTYIHLNRVHRTNTSIRNLEKITANLSAVRICTRTWHVQLATSRVGKALFIHMSRNHVVFSHIPLSRALSFEMCMHPSIFVLWNVHACIHPWCIPPLSRSRAITIVSWRKNSYTQHTLIYTHVFIPPIRDATTHNQNTHGTHTHTPVGGITSFETQIWGGSPFGSLEQLVYAPQHLYNTNNFFGLDANAGNFSREQRPTVSTIVVPFLWIGVTFCSIQRTYNEYPFGVCKFVPFYKSFTSLLAVSCFSSSVGQICT